MSLSTNTTYRVFVEKLGGTDPAQFVGDAGEVFLDPSVPTLKLSDGSTAGGTTIGGGGGGESYWESTGAGINTSSNVGVGTTNPQTKLQVGGVIGFNDTNIRIGDNTTGASITDGTRNNFIGLYAGYSNTGGDDNNFFGTAAGKYNTTGNQNVFIGRYAGEYNTTGSRNIAIGQFAGDYNTTGSSNIFLGRYSGYNLNSLTDSFGNVFIGDNAGASNTSGSRNVYIGLSAGSSNDGASRNVFIGELAGSDSEPTDWSIFLGSSTGGFGDFSTKVDHKIIIGVGSDNYNTRFDAPNPHKSHQLAIGIRTSSLPANYWIVGDENFNIGIGTTNPTTKLQVGGDVKVGVNTSQGVILTSPDGTEYRLVVANDGTLTTSLV